LSIAVIRRHTPVRRGKGSWKGLPEFPERGLPSRITGACGFFHHFTYPHLAQCGKEEVGVPIRENDTQNRSRQLLGGKQGYPRKARALKPRGDGVAKIGEGGELGVGEEAPPPGPVVEPRPVLGAGGERVGAGSAPESAETAVVKLLDRNSSVEKHSLNGRSEKKCRINSF